MTKKIYRHTPEMGEISGFGGDYEKTCQDMLEAGVKWLEANKDKKKDLKGKTFENVYGIFEADSEAAKDMEKAVMEPVKGQGATGAMHHAVMENLFYIAKVGWDKYVEECTAAKAKKETKE